METSFISILHSEGIFVVLGNIILPSALKMVIFNFIVSSALTSCGSTKNSAHQLFTLKNFIAKARWTLNFSLFIKFQNNELLPSHL